MKRSAWWLASFLAATACTTTAAPTTTTSTTSTTVVSGMRAVPAPLYGVTVDDVSNLSAIVASSQHFVHRPTTRIVFDIGSGVSDYSQAVSQLQPVSYLMGALLDSSEETGISDSAEHSRVASYLSAFGNSVDIWEIGNEVNGNWLGPYSDVENKLVDAYDQVSAAGKRSALTLYYNNGCGDGASELDPIAFSNSYVPAAVRNGLTYVFVSYYETQCGGIRPSASTLDQFFNQLHALYPNAQLGFGEVGLPNQVNSSTLSTAESIISYYYGLHLNVPGYVGGYFYWYYAEDALPYSTQPIWQALNTAFGY